MLLKIIRKIIPGDLSETGDPFRGPILTFESAGDPVFQSAKIIRCDRKYLGKFGYTLERSVLIFVTL